MSRRFCTLVADLSLSFVILSIANAEDGKSTEATASPKSENAAQGNEKNPAQASDGTGEKPTHKQSALIQINAEGLSPATVQCFCLMNDDALLAGCKGSANEVRVFDSRGKYVKSLKLPVSPEAINVASDNTILIAGEGKLLRLDKDGKQLLEVDAPHAAALRNSQKELRAEV